MALFDSPPQLLTPPSTPSPEYAVDLEAETQADNFDVREEEVEEGILVDVFQASDSRKRKDGSDHEGSAEPVPVDGTVADAEMDSPPPKRRATAARKIKAPTGKRAAGKRTASTTAPRAGKRTRTPKETERRVKRRLEETNSLMEHTQLVADGDPSDQLAQRLKKLGAQLRLAHARLEILQQLKQGDALTADTLPDFELLVQQHIRSAPPSVHRATLV